MSYYRTHTDPHPGSRFSVGWERPMTKFPDEKAGIVRSLPGPRTRLIVEGEAEFVERVGRAMADTVAEIRSEIEAGPGAES